MSTEIEEKILSDLYKASALADMISLYAPLFKFAQSYDILKDIIQGVIDRIESKPGSVYQTYPGCTELSVND